MNNGEPTPDIYLIGTGVGGGLQITLEAQRVLDRVGRAYALHLRVPLRRHLRSLRVKTVDLSDRFSEPRPLGEAYVEVADFLLERADTERPIVVLTPGSPLFLNSISRLVVLQGRRSGLRVQILPGISPLDALISYVGVDVATFGLQVFTGSRLAKSPPRLEPTVPLAVMELAGVGVQAPGADPPAEPERYVPLLKALARVYPADHPATLVNVTGGNGHRSHATLPLRRFLEFLPNIRENSHLFIDVIRPQQQRPPKEV
jgi:precorrin-6B methylase 1